MGSCDPSVTKLPRDIGQTCLLFEPQFSPSTEWEVGGAQWYDVLP
jgi:hypothetical protein